MIVQGTTIQGFTFGSPVLAAAPGQVAFTTAGTYSWTVPDKVTSVSIVTVGAGSGGSPATNNLWGGDGGPGGGLSYKNNISVTPGETLTIVVGAAGLGAAVPNNYGGNTTVSRASTLLCGATGGRGPNFPGGPLSPSDGGGTGGVAGIGSYVVNGGTNWPLGGGGGGAGGYSGNGGRGANYSQSVAAAAGTGGGGGGGAGGQLFVSLGGGGGGGVGIFGQGSNGSAGASASLGGGGGSSGGNGQNNNVAPYVQGTGGNYGGGGGGSGTWPSDAPGSTPAKGSGGAVRIIWGAGRAFPSTNTGDV